MAAKSIKRDELVLKRPGGKRAFQRLGIAYPKDNRNAVRVVQWLRGPRANLGPALVICDSWLQNR